MNEYENETENETENLQHQAEHTRPRRRAAVLVYLTILFAAAFLLLLIAYFQQRRANFEAANDANQQSVSAVQSVQDLMSDNERLRNELETAQESLNLRAGEVDELKRKLDAQTVEGTEKVDKLEKQVQAMDWFWQINEAYVRGKYTHCRQLMSNMEAVGLVAFLPAESSTDTGRFSPAERYQEISQKVKG